MKKSKLNKKNSFFTLLIKNYLLFTIVNIVIIFSIILLAALIMMKSFDFPYGEPSSQSDIFKSGQYSNLNIKNLVGEKGYIQIIDKENKVIYSGGNVDEDEVKSYTNKEIEYIPLYGSTSYDIQSKSYYDNLGNELTIISRNNYANYEDEGSKGEWFEILDSDLNVVLRAGDIKEKNTRYTKKELDYITGKDSTKYDISKYTFTDNDKKPRTLILRTNKIDDSNILMPMGKSIKITFIIFIAVYVCCITIFIIWLNRKVKKPLDKLNNAIISLSEGKNKEIIHYKGPYEFEQICNNFNFMVSKLYESEKQRILLENEKQKMLADISHDLRTPITNIQGYSKALYDGIISKEDQDKYLKIIYQKSNDLTELIDVFYEYSKLEHTDFTLTLSKKDLCEFIRAYIAEKYEYIYDINFEIDVDIPDNEMICEFDDVQLKRAFNNIINNSIKHNKEGTTIGISLKEESNNYKILIYDDGVGIPEAIVSNIFDAFVVGDDSRNTKQGSGLGLAITKKIIEKHNGSINLISLSEGRFKTTFEILLPK